MKPLRALVMKALPLADKVAVVCGASRGIGKGIAIALGEAGATVYVSARSTRGVCTEPGIGGCLEDTVKAIETAGGKAIPVECDHGDDGQVRELFERVEREQPRLDILVNCAFQLGSGEVLGLPFWEQGTAAWDPVHRVGLRSHYLATCLAAPLMIHTAAPGGPSGGHPGLVMHISSFGGLVTLFNVAYGVGKAALDRMAFDMSIELEPHNVAVVSLWPGVVLTERVRGMIASGDWESKAGMAAGGGIAAETPALAGRAVAALAADPGVMRRTGKVAVTAELAAEYGFTDADGTRPPSMRSLRFLLPTYLLPKLLGAELAARVPLGAVPDWRVPLALMRNSKAPK